MTNNTFCLEFGESYLKLVRAKLSNNIIEADSFGYVEINPAFYTSDTEKVLDDHAALIQKLINNLKIKDKNASVIIPDAYSYSQILEMPKLNEKELISAIKYQADQFIPMPIEETTIDIEILSENKQTNKIMVLMVASAKKTIEKIQKTVEIAGLIPDSIENELSGYSRFITNAFKNIKLDKGILFINLSLKTTSIYYYDPRVFLITQARNFNTGFYIFLKEICLNLNLSNKQALELLQSFTTETKSSMPVELTITPVVKAFTTEIKRFLNVLVQKNQLPVGNILFMNDSYRIPSLPKIIEKHIQVPCSQINIYDLLKKTPAVETYKNILPLFVSTIGGNLR